MSKVEDRLIENEVIFRGYNEGVQKGFEKLKRTAEEQHWDEPVEQDDTELYFYCECSDDSCQERIELKPSRYNEVHEDRSQFVVVCGHEISKIEKVVETVKDYCIVRKHETPPETSPGRSDALPMLDI